MSKYLEVICPECKKVLLVDRITGEILEIRESAQTDSAAGDKFQAAFNEMKNNAKKNEEKFSHSRAEHESHQKQLEELFNESLKEVKKQGKVEKEMRNIDLE